MDERIQANRARYRPGQKAGHYESFFQRANHPERPEAFWIRYTIFQPAGKPEQAEGELWAIHFDGETHRHTAVKVEVPMARCAFAPDRFHARVGDCTLEPTRLVGQAASRGHEIGWDLGWAGEAPVLWFLPKNLYEARFPKAKSVVAWPEARYTGTLTVDGRDIPIAGWPGSQNHNWGVKHTDTYAWGQVVGFEGHPDSTFEAITARIKLGPLWSPWMTVVALRHEGREYLLNTIGASVKARGAWRFFQWELASKNDEVEIRATIEAQREDFVALTYRNPPGGTHTCLNSKIARAEVTIAPREGAPVTLKSANRAAFEILTDRADHGVEVVV